MHTNGGFASYPSLRGRVVVVTGGASGIGQAIVEAFAAQGSRVVFLDVLEDAGAALVRRLQQTQNETQNEPGNKPGIEAPRFFPCDLTNADALAAVLEQLRAAFPAVDVLVNNAGNDTRHLVKEVTPQLWDELMAVNLKHQFFMTQGVIAGMRAAGRGSVINMSSISWMIPSTRVPVYATAKAAIVGLTRTLAHELGRDGIRVNCILPGAILTERQQRLWLTEEYKAEVLRRQALKRMIGPEEVARLVLFLAADDSAAITNQSYVIDGGFV